MNHLDDIGVGGYFVGRDEVFPGSFRECEELKISADDFLGG